MKRTLVRGLVLAFLGSALVAPAQAATPPSGPATTVSGQVTDATGQPIAGASVHAARTQLYTVTNASGQYTLTGVPAGISEVVAAKEGYDFGSAAYHGGPPAPIKLAQQTRPPRNEYPRPDADRRPFTQDAWQSLNGTWSFDFDPGNTGEANGWAAPGRAYTKAIQVPFPYQSLAAFGEQSQATAEIYRGAFDGYTGAAWYRRQFTVPSSFAGQHTRLRIGAAYWETTVWLDGVLVKPQVDYGDSELTVDLGALAAGSRHTLVIRTLGHPASTDSPYPIGRGDYLANKGGIWQSVWIEPVKAGRLETPQVIGEVTFTGSSRTPSSAFATVKVKAAGPTGGIATVAIKDPAGQQVATGSIPLTDGAGQLRTAIADPRLWDIGKPNLYTVDVALGNGDDGVRTTFGLRKVERKNAPGTDQYQYIWLNNRPVYLRGVLDQGYNPWGTITPTGEVAGPDLVTGTVDNPGQGSIVADLKNVIAQGYNLIRPHIRIAEPAYYHWADRLGLLVWLEMPNSGREKMFDNNGALFNQFKPRYEGLLRSALAINRNRASVVIWTTFNEGWGVVKPFGDLEPVHAIPFIKQMVKLIRTENPGVLVNDNSACCENGHISETDLNDVHAGLGGYDSWKPFLDEYNAKTFPGSTYKIADGGTQSGQPWLLGETTISRGGQLTNFSMYRSYPKLAGYVVVQYQDQEFEMASQYTYDRQDRGPQFVDHERNLRGTDLANGDDAISIMRESIATTRPGETLELPVKLSHFSDLDLSQAKLHWKLAGRDKLGSWVDPGVGGSKPVAPTRYTVTDAGAVSVTVPASVHSGYVWVWLEAGGKTVTENLLTFTDETPVEAAFDPMSPSKQEWSGGTATPEQGCGPQVMTGYGRGYFEYQVKISPQIRAEGGTLLFEASTAEAPNPVNNAFFTTARKFPGGLDVWVDGVGVGGGILPDDPRDALGITSRMFGRYTFPFRSGVGNEYGYRMAAFIRPEELVGKETVTVRIDADRNGLRLFGAMAGDHGLPPRLVPGRIAQEVRQHVPTVTDRPSVIYTPAKLGPDNKGVAEVTAVNGTHEFVRNLGVRLTLPAGWTATPTQSTSYGDQQPGSHGTTAYTIQAPPGATGSVWATATAYWNDGKTVQAMSAQPAYQPDPVISQPAGPGASVSGDGRAELICVNAGGTVGAWHNGSTANSPWPSWGNYATIGTGMKPGATWFADLDADGKSEILAHRPAAKTIVAWKNVRGHASPPWGGAEVTVATGIEDPARYRFADLNGDRKAELMWVMPTGEVKAWRNLHGFRTDPWDADVVIASGMNDPARVRFLDLNNDGKSEIAYIQATGEVHAWQNGGGFASFPWTGTMKVIGTGMTEPQRVKFADVTGDGKAEAIVVNRDGSLKAWLNVKGADTMPWGGETILGYNFATPEQLMFG